MRGKREKTINCQNMMSTIFMLIMITMMNIYIGSHLRRIL